MRVSADGYERVLGFDFVKEFLAAPGDAGIPRFLLLHQHSGFPLGLRSDSWIARLDHRGVPCAARELSPSSSVSLQDPQVAQIEL
jgi:hypothetical protein